MKPSSEVKELSAASIEAFDSWLYAKGRSPKTIKAYTTDLRVFLNDLGLELCEIWQFEELGLKWLTDNRRKVAPKTTARRLTSLKGFAKWAGYPTFFDDYSTPSVARPMPHPLPEGIEGVYKLIETARRQNQRALVALCGLCGLRISEALTIRPSDFDLREMILTVRGKGDRTRFVPVSERAWETLAPSYVESFVDGSELVGLQDRFARRIITDLGKRAGLQRRIASHDLRATFGTEVYNKTQDIRLVQELLGHASSKTTEGYTAVALTKMRDAVRL